MAPNDSYRPEANRWVRIACMVFGVVCLASVVAHAYLAPQFREPVFLVGGALVGAGWFAFGFFGGLPLFETAGDRTSEIDPNAVTETTRSGLRTMRRRKWAMWASIPITFLLFSLLVGQFGVEHAETIFLCLCLPWMAVSAFYVLSRCPRCGHRFFATRTAYLQGACRHCGLALNADKTRAGESYDRTR